MAVYYIIMAVILGLAYPLCIKNPSDKKKLIYVCVVFGMLFFAGIFRYGIGNDYFQYRLIQRVVYNNEFSLIDNMRKFNLEPGYIILNLLVKLLGGEYLILNILIALMAYIPVAYIVYKESKMPWISAWLYLTLTFYYNSLNFTRQSIAVSIVLLGWYFMKQKKHWAVVLTILAGGLFHVSVLILIPIYFLSLKKPSPVFLGITGGLSFLLFFFSGPIIQFLLSEVLTVYSRYLGTSYILAGLDAKFLIIPFIVMTFMLITYFAGWKDKSDEAGLLTNFAFYNFLIWLFIIKHFVLERFSLPVYTFMLIGIPEALAFWKDYRVTVTRLKGKHFKNADIMVSEDGKLKRFIGYATKNGRTIFPFVTGVLILSTFTYNDYCASQKAHGVFPYASIFDSMMTVSKKDLEDEPQKMFPARSLHEFLSLCNKGDYTTIISADGDCGDAIDLPTQIQLTRLGVNENLNKIRNKSFIGIYSNGKVIEEKVSDSIISEKIAVCDNSVFVDVISGGMCTGEPTARILVNDDYYSTNTNGLNFCVIDNKTKKVVAAQTYNTSYWDYRCTNSTAFFGQVMIEESE